MSSPQSPPNAFVPFRDDGDDSLTSLVDVVFVVVFALATLITNAPPTVVQLAELPPDTGSPDDPTREVLPIVEITADGQPRLDGEPIIASQLVATLRPRFTGASRPAVVLRLVGSTGNAPLVEQELELRVLAAGARPAELLARLSELTAGIRARISYFCLQQPELRSIRWLETQYPRPAELAGGPVLAASVSRLAMTAIAASAGEVSA